MKSILALAALAGVSLGSLNTPFTIPRCVSLCPSLISPINSRPVPDSRFNIVSAKVNSEDCTTKCIEREWIPFLVKSAPFDENSVLWMEVPDSKEYSIMIVSPDNLRFIDSEYSQLEKEIITFPTKETVTHINLEKKKTDSATKALKDEVLAKITSDKYLTEIQKLTGVTPFTAGGTRYQITSRNTYDVQHTYAANYISEYLQSTNLDQVFFQSFKYSGQNTQNIIGVKRGSTRPNEIVVIGAHMDSTSPNRADAPGCVDNGSGSDAVMMAALALSNVTTDRTIHFILFGAEEQGLIGSKYYVENMDANGYNVVSALIMDMIGYSSKYYGVKLETSNSADNRNLLDIMESNLESSSPKLTYVRSYNYFGSDHVPFIDTGIPCFLAIEQDDTDYPGYHKTTDEVGYLSVNQSVDITKAIVGALFDLAFL